VNDSDRFRELVYAGYKRADGAAGNLEHLLRLRAPFLKSIVAEHFPADRDARVVEIGCGWGALLHFARQAGYRNLRGIDRSPAQVAMAREIGLEGVVELGDAIELLAREPDGSLDAIVSLDFVEHLTRRELQECAAGLARVLRPGGRWVINTINAESPFFGRILYNDLTHEQAFTRGSITELLMLSGFARVECFEGRVIVHSLRSAVRRAMWAFFRNFMRLWLLAEFGSARGAIVSQCFLVVAEKAR